MNARVTRSIVAATGALLMAGALAAQNGSAQLRHRLGDVHRVMSNHATAVASLDPVGAVEGWGHIMVRDVELAGDELQRVVVITLSSLAPEAAYTVIADGVPLATVTTDTYGDVWTRLESPSGALDPVPEDLPRAIELMGAEVVDASGAPTLEGLFHTTSFGANGPQELVYFERIVLENDSATIKPRGVAKVAVDANAVETFSTHACGLEPNAGYEVRVDTVTVGVVTSDAVGYGRLELKSEGDGALLPEGIGTVQEFVLVEWAAQADSSVVLSGSFTGESMLGQGPIRDQQGNGPNDNGNRSGGQQGGDGGPCGGNGVCNGGGQEGGAGGPRGGGICNGGGNGSP